MRSRHRAAVEQESGERRVRAAATGAARGEPAPSHDATVGGPGPLRRALRGLTDARMAHARPARHVHDIPVPPAAAPAAIT